MSIIESLLRLPKLIRLVGNAAVRVAVIALVVVVEKLLGGAHVVVVQISVVVIDLQCCWARITTKTLLN